MGTVNTKEEAFQKLFQYFIDELNIYLVTGEVTKVNKSTKTCEVQPYTNEPKLLNVRYALMPSSEIGIIVEPQVGSQVGIMCMEYGNGQFAQVISIQEFAEIRIDNGQSFAAQAKKTADKIKALEDKVNDLYDEITSHKHIGVSSGTSTSGVLSPTDVAAVQAKKITVNTDEAAIKSPKIKIP